MATTVKVEVRDQVRGVFNYELHVGESVMRDPKFLLSTVETCAGNVFTEMNSDICQCGGVGYMQHIVGCPVLSLGKDEDVQLGNFHHHHGYSHSHGQEPLYDHGVEHKWIERRKDG